MKRALIVGGVVAAVAVLFIALFASQRALEQNPNHNAEESFALRSSPPPADAEAAAAAPKDAVEDTQGFLYGRVQATDGATYEGRLRFGVNQEASWGDDFNGTKSKNPWLEKMPQEQRPKTSHRIDILGLKFAVHERELEVTRPFKARFGEIKRIEAHGDQVSVTLKDGTVVDVGRFDSSDFDDGVRVWDATRGIVDLENTLVRSIELLPGPARAAAPVRLHGTVRTRHGEFTGFIGWNREDYVGSDELEGRTDRGRTTLRYDGIRSIARRMDGSMVTLLDGREVLLSNTSDVDRDNRGIYVEDPRFGRVLVSWDAFQRVDFSPGGSGPAYADFPPGVPLQGSVTARDGRRLVGRLVYDLDESESTEMFDAPAEGVDYSIPFGMIASIVVPAPEDIDQRAEVVLHNGQKLELEPDGDLGGQGAGVLIFVGGQERPEYVSWPDVARVDLDRPAAMYPPLQ